MLLKHMAWIFAGLFVLFSAAILMTESTVWRQFWAGLCTLSLGGFAASMVKDALTTGQIRAQNSVIRHADQPRLFWAVVILYAAAGVGVLITGLWALFFKN
jgi:hypothetical protein